VRKEDRSIEIFLGDKIIHYVPQNLNAKNSSLAPHMLRALCTFAPLLLRPSLALVTPSAPAPTALLLSSGNFSRCSMCTTSNGSGVLAMGGETMLVKRLSDAAVMPARGSKDAAGFDLSAAHSSVIPAGGMGLVKTDLAIALPAGTYGRVAPRSGLAFKKQIATGAGVIDADYRGNVGVILFNHGKNDFEVAPGDRIAQLVLERISMADLQEVDDLPETVRGAGGFGSTGVTERLSPSDGGEAPKVSVDGTTVTKKQRMEDDGSDLISFLLQNLQKLPLPDVGRPGWAMSKLRELALSRDERLTGIIKAHLVQGDDNEVKAWLEALLGERE
jgi:dUTP pyrophosphatase